jgi:hypothetical protein
VSNMPVSTVVFPLECSAYFDRAQIRLLLVEP